MGKVVERRGICCFVCSVEGSSGGLREGFIVPRCWLEGLSGCLTALLAEGSIAFVAVLASLIVLILLLEHILLIDCQPPRALNDAFPPLPLQSGQ